MLLTRIKIVFELFTLFNNFF